MIQIRFNCGHGVSLTETEATVPTCPCGEQQIRRVSARAPRFRGACQGPYAASCSVSPVTLDLTAGQTLILKESD